MFSSLQEFFKVLKVPINTIRLLNRLHYNSLFLSICTQCEDINQQDFIASAALHPQSSSVRRGVLGRRIPDIYAIE